MNPEQILIGNDLAVLDLRNDLPDGQPGYGPREAGQLRRLIVHHDALAFDSDDEADELERIRDVYAYHRHNNGWPGIAYHFYVFPSGRVYYTGDWATVRYHTAGPDDPATPQHISAYNED